MIDLQRKLCGLPLLFFLLSINKLAAHTGGMFI
jgi:hypothetical protein